MLPRRSLSAREREVAAMVAAGKSNRVIAEALCLSERTVEHHVTAALNKLNARSRVELATIVLRETPPAPKHNLPIQRTSFVGRAEEIAEIVELVRGNPMVTLTGSGGVGKTRTSLEVAAQVLDDFDDGVWFVDFSPIADRELVSSVIASVLGVSQQEGRRTDEAISRWLRRKALVLILDNCEHVLETVASVAEAILATAHGVHILATSRQAIDIRGEVVHRLPSLSTQAGVALFVDRAKASDTRFAVSGDGATIVADICRRLDGIPLAIELAAVRVKVLGLSDLARRLDDRFRILTAGKRDVLPRQKTLGALIDWSYNLLDPREQLLFARLGIFSGGFGLDAVTAVCGQDLDEIDVLDRLALLTEKSLVVAESSSEHQRYHLLESTAAYALERLTAAGQRESLARRHAEYFRDRAQAADEAYGFGSTSAWLAAVELELDNYRAALGWALTHGKDPGLGGAIAGALDHGWIVGGLTVEGRYWIALALERLNEAEHPRVAARLQLALSKLVSGKRKHDAAARAVRLYESVNDSRGSARARDQLAFGLYQMDRLEEAVRTSASALAAARACGDAWGVARLLNRRATMEFRRGDPRQGRALFAQSLAAFRELGDEGGIVLALVDRADAEFADGHPKEALRLSSEALPLLSRAKHVTYLAVANNNSAAYRIALGDLRGARDSAREGLRWARDAQVDLPIIIALQHLALLSALAGDAGIAAKLLGYVDVRYAELAAEREPTEKWGYDRLIGALAQHLGEGERERLAAEGATWSEDQAIDHALECEIPLV